MGERKKDQVMMSKIERLNGLAEAAERTYNAWEQWCNVGTIEADDRAGGYYVAWNRLRDAYDRTYASIFGVSA